MILMDWYFVQSFTGCFNLFSNLLWPVKVSIFVEFWPRHDIILPLDFYKMVTGYFKCGEPFNGNIPCLDEGPTPSQVISKFSATCPVLQRLIEDFRLQILRVLKVIFVLYDQCIFTDSIMRSCFLFAKKISVYL